MTDRLTGVIPIVPTPFTTDGEVDLPALDRLLDFLVDVGVDGLAVLGMASETITLTEAERLAVVERAAVRVDRRLPLVAGCSHVSPQGLAQLTRATRAAGAQVVMAMPPTIGAPDARSLVEYFLAAADASDAHVMIQDNPGWHGVTVPLSVYREVAHHPNVRYAKVETSHPPTTMAQVSDTVGAELALLGGQAGRWLPEELRRGIVGTMPGAIMPQVYLAVWRLWRAGERARATAVFEHYHPLIRVTGAPHLGIPMTKQLLAATGVLGSTTVRAPFRPPTRADLADLDAVIESLRIVSLMRGEVPVHGADPREVRGGSDALEAR